MDGTYMSENFRKLFEEILEPAGGIYLGSRIVPVDAFVEEE